MDSLCSVRSLMVLQLGSLLFPCPRFGVDDGVESLSNSLWRCWVWGLIHAGCEDYASMRWWKWTEALTLGVASELLVVVQPVCWVVVGE